MQYISSYTWIKPLDISKYRNCRVYAPEKDISVERNTIDEALAYPIGTQGLEEMVRWKSPEKVLILADDISRPTPQKEIVPKVIEVLHRAGIRKNNITILIATGMHRAMSAKEIEERFGREIAGEYRIQNHNARKKEDLVKAGTSDDGTEIYVNRLIKECDFSIAIGQIAPHRVVGFSGGAKMIQPGICGEETTIRIHWKGWTTDSQEIFAVSDNPVRNEINDIGCKVGLDFVINVLMDDDQVLHYYAGDHLEVFHTASEDIIDNFGMEIPESEIVVVDAAPYDFDIWQAAKAVSVGELVVKRNGTVILLASCPDEWTPDYYETARKTGYLPYDKIVEMVEIGRLDRLIGCHFCAFGRVLQEGRVVIISNHLKKEDIEAMNFIHAGDLEEAIDREIQRFGPDARISILDHANKLIPKRRTIQ